MTPLGLGLDVARCPAAQAVVETVYVEYCLCSDGARSAPAAVNASSGCGFIEPDAPVGRFDLEMTMEADSMNPFFTIGHSTRSVADLVEMLRPAQVRLVVDVDHAAVADQPAVQS